MGPFVVFGLVAALVIVKMSVFILQEYERGVVFTLGRLSAAKGPGLRFVIPGLQKLLKVDQRIVAMDIPSQDVITRDNVSVKVNAVFYYRVMDPSSAIVQVKDYQYATSQLAQTLSLIHI